MDGAADLRPSPTAGSLTRTAPSGPHDVSADLGAAEAETSEHVSISATTSNDDLVGVYHSHMFDITQATTIGGLPALVGQNSVNRASRDITIGTAIGAGLDVDYDQPTYPDTPGPDRWAGAAPGHELATPPDQPPLMCQRAWETRRR